MSDQIHTHKKKASEHILSRKTAEPNREQGGLLAHVQQAQFKLDSLASKNVLNLQRMFGNQAVRRLLTSRTQHQQGFSFPFGRLQRVIDYNERTVGVEQEMSSNNAPRIVIPNRNNRGRQGYVKKGSTTLVEFHSDIGGGTANEYTIELKTTPVESKFGDQLDNNVGVQDRLRATKVLVGAIVRAGNEQRAVAPGTYDDLEIVIDRSEHTIKLSEFKTGATTKAEFSNQASIGIPTADFLNNTPDAQLVLESAHWYKPELKTALETNGLKEADKAQTIYSLIASAIIFLAGRIDAFPDLIREEDNLIVGDTYNSRIKDSWDVLPRTPVWDWLNVLDAADQNQVKAKLRQEMPDVKHYKAALNHISLGYDLAGHPIPKSTIKGQQSSVFEFRTVPEKLKPYLYVASGKEEEVSEELLEQENTNSSNKNTTKSMSKTMQKMFEIVKEKEQTTDEGNDDEWKTDD